MTKNPKPKTKNPSATLRASQKSCSVVHRMNFISGHLKANLKMIAEGRYCIDIIRQNQAVIAALKKVNQLILKDHLDSCVTRAIKGKSEKERRRVLDELVEIFKEGD